MIMTESAVVVDVDGVENEKVEVEKVDFDFVWYLSSSSS